MNITFTFTFNVIVIVIVYIYFIDFNVHRVKGKKLKLHSNALW